MAGAAPEHTPDVVEPMLRAVFANSPDAVVIARDGRVRTANRNFLRLTGFSDEADIVGKPVLEFVAPQSRHIVAEIFRRRAAGEPTSVWLTVTGVRRDGHEFSMDVRSTSCILGDEHYTVAFIRARREHTESSSSPQDEALYRAVFEVNTAVKLLISPETGRILDANRAAAEFYGWPLDELRTMRITDINTLTPEEVQAEMNNARSLRRGYFRFRHRTASGAIKHVEVYSGPVELAGQVLLLSIVHDVTERDELEEQLHRARHMESIGRLAGGVAHDYNNLLTVMLTSTDLLARALDDDSPLRQRVTDLQHAARRAAELTRGLLALGGRQLLQLEPVQINELIARTIRLIRSDLPNEIEIHSDLAGDLPSANIDPAQIEQVLMNLALNAREAMADGGTLGFRSEVRNVQDDGVVPDGRWILVHVTDTGHGMDEATRARLFEPFFTTKAHGGGTGLGLAQVYGIVSQSGGYITLDSKPNQGSTFSVYLPIADTAPREQPPRETRATAGGATVLLVEDVSGVRGVLAEVLDQAGFHVIQAESAEQALDIAERQLHAIDIVVSDVVMPGRSGTALAQDLLARRPSLPIILMSGHVRDRDRNQLPDGVQFVAKPFSAHELVGFVDGALRSKPS